MNMYEDTINCESWDQYIKEKRAEGIEIGYMHIFIAGLVRLLAIRPRLNRFVMLGKVYARPKIWVSFVVHPSLDLNSEGTTIKLAFEGTETILEIAEKINEAIQKETTNRVGENGTDKLARVLTRIPSPILRFVVNTLMWMDKHNCLPKMVMDASPFHTSFFITNMKSLGINYVFHHVYNFGTAGIFIGLGKDKTKVVADLDDQPEVRKMLPLGVVIDERFAEGLDWAKGMKQLKRLLRDPHLLDKPIEKKNEDID